MPVKRSTRKLLVFPEYLAVKEISQLVGQTYKTVGEKLRGLPHREEGAFKTFKRDEALQEFYRKEFNVRLPEEAGDDDEILIPAQERAWKDREQRLKTKVDREAAERKRVPVELVMEYLNDVATPQRAVIRGLDIPTETKNELLEQLGEPARRVVEYVEKGEE